MPKPKPRDDFKVEPLSKSQVRKLFRAAAISETIPVDLARVGMQ